MEPNNTLLTRASAPALFAASGAGLLIAQALLPTSTSDAADQVAVAAAHRGAELGSAVAFLVAGALLVLCVAASNRMQLDRGRTLVRIGLVVTGIGALWPVAGRAVFNAILVALTGAGHGSASVTAVHAISNSAAFALFLPALLAFLAGPLLLALGLRRAGALQIWPAVLWVAGVITVNAAEAQSRIVATVGMALAGVALAWLGRGVMQATTPETAR